MFSSRRRRSTHKILNLYMKMFNLVRNVHGEVWGCDLWCGSRSIRFQNIFIKINSNIYHETNSCFCWCLINLLEDVSDILNSILTFDRVESVSQRLDWSRNVWKMFFWYHRECWTAWENILKKIHRSSRSTQKKYIITIRPVWFPFNSRLILSSNSSDDIIL